ncbi:hypothetical protein, partial [uncultured Desulfovibrio sp.]|uniref:hypothetical protein n=1 Tax=uncultured Desulfovibrio sp. TaxID=167968 RepID=UPI0025965EC0
GYMHRSRCYLLSQLMSPEHKACFAVYKKNRRSAGFFVLLVCCAGAFSVFTKDGICVPCSDNNFCYHRRLEEIF